jgi:glycosyltransferase involved in cell wall biosynthesis
MLAPPWITVPPTGYGGVETVVSVLTEELTSRGHDVTLFCAPGSWSTAKVAPLLAATHPDEIERALYESDHVARALAQIAPVDGPSPFDVIHDHCGFTMLAMADRVAVPVVHTIHGPFDEATSAFYAAHGGKAALVAISNTQLATAPVGLKAAAVISNPIDASTWQLTRKKEGYVLWIGRITEDKGPHRAIAAAQLAGVPIILAGVVQPGQEAFFEREIRPHLDDSQVRFVGEIGGAPKRALFAGALAMLMPIRWPEPFGMVMVEALASGTPVIAFPEGAASEIVINGETGFLVDDEVEMAAAIGAIPSLSSTACRQWVLDHCDVRGVARGYEDVYRAAIARSKRVVLNG